MPDYISKLDSDLLEQFKKRENISVLTKAVGRQMNELYAFFESLKTERYIRTASGIQLDNIGEILALTRRQAQEILGIYEPLNDEMYRKMLVYKAQLNFGDATYKAIMNTLKVIHGDDMPFYVVEELEHPATLILETKKSPSEESVQSMLDTPVPRAGGVGLIIRAHDSGETGFGLGITSQMYLELPIETMEAHNVDEFTWYEDEFGNMLTDERGNILID